MKRHLTYDDLQKKRGENLGGHKLTGSNKAVKQAAENRKKNPKKYF